MGAMAEADEASEGSKALTVRLSAMPAEARATILDTAIQRYSDGESVYKIAEELGIEHTTLYRHLVKHREGDWREAKVGRALAELEDAEESLKSAPDGLALTRARERIRAAQWHLERLIRRIYGEEKVALNLQGDGIKVELVSFAPPQYDSEAAQQRPIIEAPPVDRSE